MPAASANYQFFNLASAVDYLGDRQGVRDMLPLLKQSLARDVPELTQLLAKGDTVEAAARLHSLKGFLPIFCYPTLVEELVRIEKWCKSGPDPELPGAYGALALQLQRLGQEVLDFESHKE